MARAPPLVPFGPSPPPGAAGAHHHAPLLRQQQALAAPAALRALSGAGDRDGAPMPQQLLALPPPPPTGMAGTLAGHAPPAPQAAAPASSGGGVQRLQLDKLLSLLESGLPLGGDLKVRLLAARGLAGGADRHTNAFGRLVVGGAGAQSPPVWGSSAPAWDHEETFEEVGAGATSAGPHPLIPLMLAGLGVLAANTP
jgi:hypothetical protein